MSKKETETSPPKQRIDAIKVYSYPDTIFFWPTPIVSFVLCILALIPYFQTPDLINIFSWIWLIGFIWNLFIVAFDYSSSKTFAFLALIVALVLVFIVIFITTGWNVVNYILIFLLIPINFNWAYYLTMGVVFTVLILIMLLAARISYVEIRSNRVFIKKGILADKIDQPTVNMMVEKTIDDVFEYFVLRSGDLKLIFPPGSKHQMLVLPNVININKKIEDINYIISKEEVDIL